MIGNQLLLDKQRNKRIYGVLALLLLVLIAIAVLAPGVVGKTDVKASENVTNTSDNNTTDDKDLFSDKAYPVYAKGYSVEYHGTYKVVQIHDPWGRAAENTTYLLVQRGEKVPDGYPDARVFSIPVKSVVPLTVTQLPCISLLGETPSITGFNGINLVYGDDEEFNKRVSEGKIVEIGSMTADTMGSIDTEKIIDLQPDVIFCTVTEDSTYDNQAKLLEAGLNPAVDGEWKENSPLARAEWIKYLSLFYNKEKTANDVFEQIEHNYTSIRDKVAAVSNKPTLFSGFEYQGTWYAPGDNSYVGQLFRDAGGDYVLGNIAEDTGDVSLDFEKVYDSAQGAEFWINTGYGNPKNLTDILALDERNSKFGAFKTGKIYNYNARVNANGGNDYWQSAVVHPDIVLEDLVKILHPEMVPNHEQYYYKQIVGNNSENETGNSSNVSSDSSSGGNSGGSSSGGSGGGGAGGSPEPQSNVEVKELSQTNIGNGNSVVFDFPQDVTPVVYVSFDSKKTAGKTTTIVEMLKNQSTLVLEPSADEIYKFINIWVGNSGFATSENIENAKVKFKVEKSWIQDKNIEKSSITLNRYSDTKWNTLPTNLSGEDDKYLYFTAETPGFSPFTITGQVTVKEKVTETQSENQTGPNIGSVERNASNAANEQTPSQTQSSSKKTPGFEIIYGIICLFVVFLHKRE